MWRGRIQSQHTALSQRCQNAGPASLTLAQHCASVGIASWTWHRQDLRIGRGTSIPKEANLCHINPGSATVIDRTIIVTRAACVLLRALLIRAWEELGRGPAAGFSPPCIPDTPTPVDRVLEQLSQWCCTMFVVGCVCRAALHNCTGPTLIAFSVRYFLAHIEPMVGYMFQCCNCSILDVSLGRLCNPRWLIVLYSAPNRSKWRSLQDCPCYSSFDMTLYRNFSYSKKI